MITAEGWIAGVERITYSGVGGTWAHQPYKWLWHTTEGGTIGGALATYPKTRAVPHLTWEPKTGRIVQHIPFSRSATALRNQAGGVETNRDGVIQVEVVGFAREPFTSGPMLRLQVLRDAWRALGIPEVWPAGQPLAAAVSFGANGQRSRAAWAKPGHFGHSQVPENDHGDPGAIEIRKLWGSAPVQPPAPPPEEDTMNLRIPIADPTHPGGILLLEPETLDLQVVPDGETWSALVALKAVSADRPLAIDGKAFAGLQLMSREAAARRAAQG